MDVTYEGPRRFVADDDDPKPVRLTLETTEPLPEGTAVSAVLGGTYRSVGGWSLEGVSASAGAVEITRDVPDGFEETYRSHVPESYRDPPKQYQLATATVRETVPAGATVGFDLAGTLSEHVGIEPTFGIRLRRPGADESSPVGDPVTVENVPGEPVALAVRARPEPQPDGRHRVVVSAIDGATNPVPAFDGTVEFDARGDGSVGDLPDSATPDGDGRIVLSLAVEEGPVRIAAQDADHDLEGTSAALFGSPLGADGHYYGGIHFHTRYSHDGDRDVREAYRHARDYLNLDVVAVTDHTPGTDAWERTVRVNEEYDDPGAFATIPAWEWSAVEGHANVYLRSPAVDAGPDVAEPMEVPSYGHFDVDFGDDPTVHPAAVDWPEGVVLVPHHTSAGGGKYWKWWDWSRENDRIRAVEIVQGRGNFEADEADEYWDVRYEGRGASVQDALERGYRLGFVAGTDNHQGFPTVWPDGPTGLTCFVAGERTREAAWDAMNDRRTYATSGVPIRCRYAVNGHPLGSEATLDGDSVAFSAGLYGTDEIERVEVVSGRETVWSDEPGARDVVIDEEPLPAPEGASAYYYLRLRQVDGHRAWVSPVWLDRD